MDRANAEKENMGLNTWRNAPKGKISLTLFYNLMNMNY